ncbi:MAG: discoidin domain-containing protein [Lachnospiraceae bacterium]|nr:discoidin domain-containing protein [Lachnospiraceae bacterium]
MKRLRGFCIIVLALAAVAVWGTTFVLQAQNKQSVYGEVTIVETPEQTESITPAAFVKEEFVPVIPKGTNIAQEARFDANGFNDVYPPGNAKDGETQGASYWEGVANEYPNIFTAVFEEPRQIHALKLLLCPKTIWGPRVQTFSVEVSQDGETFTELLASTDYRFDPATGNELVLEFDEVEVEAVQLTFTGNTGATGAQIAELEIYSVE